MTLTTPALFAHFPRRLLSVGLLAVGLFLTFTSAPALADERCQQLEALNRQYAGVVLTIAQRQMKRQMVAWYKQNCTMRRADARR